MLTVWQFGLACTIATFGKSFKEQVQEMDKNNSFQAVTINERNGNADNLFHIGLKSNDNTTPFFKEIKLE